MAQITIGPTDAQPWYAKRATLGNLGIATILNIGSGVRSILIVAEGTAIWVSAFPVEEGGTIPADAYIIIPANNALRIPCVSDEALAPHGAQLTRLALAGAANAATVGVAAELGDFVARDSST